MLLSTVHQKEPITELQRGFEIEKSKGIPAAQRTREALAAILLNQTPNGLTSRQEVIRAKGAFAKFLESKRNSYEKEVEGTK